MASIFDNQGLNYNFNSPLLGPGSGIVDKGTNLFSQIQQAQTRNLLDTIAQAETRKQQQAQTEANNLNRRQGIGNLLFALSDAFAGRDIGTGFLERQEFLKSRAEAERQRQEELERQQTIQTLGTNLTPEQQTLARLFPSEYADYVFSKDTSPKISLIQQQDSEFAKEAAKAGFKTQQEAQKQVTQFADIENRLDILQKQLEGADPVQTGVIEEIKIPFKRLAAGLNILPQDELDKLSQQELFIATTGYIIPRMRVAGSGSTSDREIELFKSAVPNLGNTVDGNKVLVGGLQAIAKYNKKRLFEMDKYLKENKSLLGFGEFADEKLGPLYKEYNSDDDFDLQVKQGNLKAGDFVRDNINGQFRILDKEDIEGVN
jgi:hypothetical protein